MYVVCVTWYSTVRPHPLVIKRHCGHPGWLTPPPTPASPDALSLVRKGKISPDPRPLYYRLQVFRLKPYLFVHCTFRLYTYWHVIILYMDCMESAGKLWRWREGFRKTFVIWRFSEFIEICSNTSSRTTHNFPVRGTSASFAGRTSSSMRKRSVNALLPAGCSTGVRWCLVQPTPRALSFALAPPVGFAQSAYTIVKKRCAVTLC